MLTIYEERVRQNPSIIKERTREILDPEMMKYTKTQNIDNTFF